MLPCALLVNDLPGSDPHVQSAASNDDFRDCFLLLDGRPQIIRLHWDIHEIVRSGSVDEASSVGRGSLGICIVVAGPGAASDGHIISLAEVFIAIGVAGAAAAGVVGLVDTAISTARVSHSLRVAVMTAAGVTWQLAEVFLLPESLPRLLVRWVWSIKSVLASQSPTSRERLVRWQFKLSVLEREKPSSFPLWNTFISFLDLSPFHLDSSVLTQFAPI
ncbi:hypothetical protein N7535_007779 [Penicillium sp. DV-2018c]|nr:hypothetical protein N7461_003814 [Penicillium sp. DV-2018c]KAJ5566141.1 hypothetical protein N7535_007779 [Penicillium sp. DV-2018c]